MSGQGKFWQAVDKRAKKTNPAVASVGVIKTLKPISIFYNGIEISVANGDTIYLNNLILDDNINLDISSMDSAQNIKSLTPPAWISQGTSQADYTAEISGTQKTFLTDFYTWAKSVHNRFILHIGDFVAVQKLGNNTYIILNKLQKVEDEQ